MSLLGDLIINVLAKACLKYQRSRHVTLSLIPTTPTHTILAALAVPATLTAPTTPKTLLLPPTPKAPQQLPLYHTKSKINPSLITLLLSQSYL